MKLIFLDTETTGLEKKDRLIQLGYIKDDALGGLEVNELFKPEIKISPDAMSVHHITNKMVEDKSIFKSSEQYERLQSYIDNGYIIVAHNAKFDIGMLEKEGIKFKDVICTLKVARHIDKQGVIDKYNLQYLRYLLELDVEADAHDVIGDVKVMKELFEKRLMPKMIEQEEDEDSAIKKMIEITSKPQLMVKINFGKYKGEEFSKIAKDYLNWLEDKSDFIQNDEDLMYTVNYYLKK